MHKGSCVTSVLPGEVCDLTTAATECPETSLMATTCTCIEEGFQYNGTACIGKAVNTFFSHGCIMLTPMQILMNVLISLSQSFPVMRMHTATTLWAVMCVSAMMATLEMALPA